jgi:hypothetical protein
VHQVGYITRIFRFAQSKKLKIVRGKVNKLLTNRDLKEMNGGNDIQTTFIFQRNLRVNINTCPTVSQVPGNLRCKILYQRGNLHRPTDSMFHFIYSCSCDLQLAPQWAMRHETSQDIELKYVSSIEYMSQQE